MYNKIGVFGDDFEEIHKKFKKLVETILVKALFSPSYVFIFKKLPT